MKKILILAALVALTPWAKAAEVTDAMANESALSLSTNFDFPASNDGANRIGAIVTYTSATVAAKTFSSGATSSGTITVVSTVALSGQYITIGSYKFCAGVAGVACAKSNYTYFFDIGANVNATAANLAGKIAATYAVTGASASVSSAQVDVITVAQSAGYAMTTSGAKMTIAGNVAGGSVATVSASTDRITIASHGFSTGLKVALTGSSLPGALTATDYWVYKVDANTIKLSSTAILAAAGTAIDITSVPLGATANTYTLTPAAITGTPGFKWKASNDNEHWIDMSVSSITMSAYVYGGTSSFWDFSWFPYKWLRLAVDGPTTGAIYLKADLSVKR